MTWTKLFGTAYNHAVDSDVSATIDTTGVTLLVVVTGQNDIADNFGNVFAQIAHGTRGGVDLRVFVSLYPLVGTGHVFRSSSNGTAEVYGWTGNIRPVDLLAVAQGAPGGTTVTVGPGTPSENNELLLAGFGIDNPSGGAPYSVDSGFSIIETQDLVGGQYFGSVLAALIQTTAAAVSPKMTRSNASSHGDNGTLISFKALPGHTPSIVAHTSIGSAVSATSPSINTTGATVLVATFTQLSAQTTGTQQAITDSQGNRWLPFGPAFLAGDVSTRWFVCWNPSTSATHTFTIPGSNGAACFVAIKDVVVADPINIIGAPTTSGSGASVPAGSITPTVDGALVFAGWELGDPNATGSPAYTVNNGFTLDEFKDVVSGSTWGSAAAWLIQATAAAISTTLTRTNSGSTGTDQGVMIAFTPEPSVGPSSANADASIPITLGFSATAKAIAKAAATIAIALGATCAASAPAKLSATAPIAIGVSATARAPAQVAASIPIALGAESTAIALAKANAAIPISIGVTAVAKSTLVNVASISIPLNLGVVSTSRARATAAVSVPIALTVAGQAQAPAHATARITISLGVVAHASSGNAFIPARSPTQFVVTTHPRTIAIATRPRLFVFTIVPRTIHFDD